MKNKKGMTLIDMMTAIVIFTMGIAGFTMLFRTSWSMNSYVLELGQATFTAERGLDLISQDLRKIKQADNSAYPIKSGGNFDLTVYSDIDNDGITEQVHYFLDDDQHLKRGSSKPNSSVPPIYPAGDDEVIVLADYVTNSKTGIIQPIFMYYDKNYDGSSAPLSIPIIKTDVRLVRIHLWVNIKPVKAPDNVNLESFVELRNLNENLY